MPELPEVNTVQKYFNAQAPGQKIIEVEVWDDHIIRNISGDAFVQMLTGQIINGSYRQGKYLFASLDSGHYVQLHLGMTGDISFYNSPEDQPRYERFRWELSGGQYMGFYDPRKFGRIVYINNLQSYIVDIGLGQDALTISEEAFLKPMENRRMNVKAYLLDQRILSGVGNLYADEICFQVRIHPASVVSAIPLRKCKALYHKMREILEFACAHDAYYGVYPKNWFWKWREKGLKNPMGSGIVSSAKIAGRTSYFVEGWQKLYI